RAGRHGVAPLHRCSSAAARSAGIGRARDQRVHGECGMSIAAYRTPRPAPPHDPLNLVLSADEGWQDAGASSNVTVPRKAGALALTLLAPPGPVLTDPSGILGGLLPPPWVAPAP